MVIAGNSRNRPELRKKQRQQFHYSASILKDGKGPPLPCQLCDISATGARLMLKDDCELPDRFILLLTQTGDARRSCRVVWRTGLALGVEFPNVQS